MIKDLLSFYRPGYPKTLIYMLQRTEYEAIPFLKWHWQTSNFKQVTKRGQLDKTKKARALLLFIRLGITVEVLLGLFLIWRSISGHIPGWWEVGVLLIVAYPLVWAYLVVVPLELARLILVKPEQNKLVRSSQKIFKDTKAVKIAVAGSYGKTTMKELLAIVLAESFKVAATPANKNTPVSHARFAAKLSGDEDVLIIEYGEGAPGDIPRFVEITQPNQAVITGLAPAHLNKYADLKAAGNDIFFISGFLNHQNVYVNGESQPTKGYIKEGDLVYGLNGVGNWKASNIKVDYSGVSFELSNKDVKLKINSKLLGRHQVGPLSAVAVIGISLGMKPAEVEDGILKTVPFAHRMEPREQNGAFVIDDTYNGNIDGIRAGLELLTELPARRKIYITPGLVDQGVETKSVHAELGKLIAKASPDKVILMNNSVTDYIKRGLAEGNYRGDLVIESDPLGFYTNLDQFLAAGDLVLLQNDWPDNYY